MQKALDMELKGHFRFFTTKTVICKRVCRKRARGHARIADSAVKSKIDHLLVGTEVNGKQSVYGVGAIVLSFETFPLLGVLRNSAIGTLDPSGNWLGGKLRGLNAGVNVYGIGAADWSAAVVFSKYNKAEEGFTATDLVTINRAAREHGIDTALVELPVLTETVTVPGQILILRQGVVKLLQNHVGIDMIAKQQPNLPYDPVMDIPSRPTTFAKGGGIGFHGDSERKLIAIGCFGAPRELHVQPFRGKTPVYRRVIVKLHPGDLYFSTPAAAGHKWKTAYRNKNTIHYRHAVGPVGGNKFTHEFGKRYPVDAAIRIGKIGRGRVVERTLQSTVHRDVFVVPSLPDGKQVL